MSLIRLDARSERVTLRRWKRTFGREQIANMLATEVGKSHRLTAKVRSECVTDCAAGIRSECVTFTDSSRSEYVTFDPNSNSGRKMSST